MALLSPRQLQAEKVKQALHDLGAIVTNCMPLSPDSAGLTFQILDEERAPMLERLSAWNWTPTLISSGPRFCLDGTARPASTYQLRIEVDRQPIPDDSRIAVPKDEVVSREVKEFRKLHGLGPR